VSFKIYYLDDEVDLLDIFVDTFSSDDVHITTFTSAAEFLSAIRTNLPDLIFLDYKLPGTTGLEVARLVDPTIPKALISGDMSLSFDSIFHYFFEKPMKASAVAEYINSFKRNSAAT